MSAPDTTETASRLGEHRFVNGGGESGLIFPIACACGTRTPGWAAWEGHVAEVLDAEAAARDAAQRAEAWREGWADAIRHLIEYGGPEALLVAEDMRTRFHKEDN